MKVVVATCNKEKALVGPGGPSFQALETSSTILGCNDDVDKIRELIINIASKVRASSSSGPTNAKWKQMDRSGFNAIYVT